MGSYVFQVEYTCFLILRTLLDLQVLSNCVNVTLLKQKQLLSDYLYFKIYVYLQWFSMGRGKILSSGGYWPVSGDIFCCLHQGYGTTLAANLGWGLMG